jgi:acetyl esterase
MQTNRARTALMPSSQAQAYLNGTGRPNTHWFDLDLETLRRNHRAEFSWARGYLAEVAEVADMPVNGVPARLYSGVLDAAEVLVWLHGGGWKIGGVDEHDELCRALANHARCAVLSVGYRLAPEHRFPAAVEDAWSALMWAGENFGRVAVGGDSAGGNLAAVSALRARDAGLRLDLQVLIYAVVDHPASDPAHHRFARTYAGFNGDPAFGEYTCRLIEDCWDQYIPDPAMRSHPDAAPLHAHSHAKLAPAFLLTAEHDILCAQNIEYARRLRASGVSVQHDHYPGQVHAFYPFVGLLDDSRRAVMRTAAVLRRAFDAACRPMTSRGAAEDTPLP